MAAMTSTLPEKLEAEQAREVEQASDAESTDSWFSDLNLWRRPLMGEHENTPSAKTNMYVKFMVTQILSCGL